jgi:dihydroorotase
VIDPMRQFDGIADVVVLDGRIAAVGRSVGDRVATPIHGRDRRLHRSADHPAIGIHVHVMKGQRLLRQRRRVGVQMGVPVVVDGGVGRRVRPRPRAVIDHPHTKTKVLAFVDPNQLYLATKDFICHKLLIANDLKNLDVDSLLSCMERNADVIVGLKVRACHVGDPERSPFLEGAQAASGGKPVMVHLGRFPHAGDHAAGPAAHAAGGMSPTPSAVPGMLDSTGKAIPEFRDMSTVVSCSTSATRAPTSASERRRLIDQGYLPDTISTDLNVFNIGGPVFSRGEHDEDVKRSASTSST